MNKILELLKKKRKLTAVIGVIIIAAGLLGWYLFAGEETVTAEAATATVTVGTIEVKVSGTGAVRPTATRSITPNQGGTIASINVKNGQQVKQGDLLFELRNDGIETEIRKAELDLRQAQLEYSIKLAERSDQNVSAPVSGQVTALEVDSGQDVQQNAALMVINDTSKLAVKLPVNGAQIDHIKVGQAADVTIPALMSTVQGRVRKVDRGGTAGSDGSRMYNVTIEISNPGALSPGLEAQAVISTPQGPETAYGSGQLEWVQTLTVRAGVSGNIKQLYVDENDYVKKGQKLAYIASDNIDTQLESQQLRLEQARLTLEQAQKKLADCKIYAPVDGIINLGTSDTDSSGGGSNANSSGASGSGQYWQVGDEVSTNQVLATLVDNAGMRVTVPVDEVDIAKVKMGQKAAITIDALLGKTFTGTVTEIAAKGTEQNGVASFDVTVSMGQHEELKENMTANVEIMIEKKDRVLVLPVEAVQERQGRKFVLAPAGGGTAPASVNPDRPERARTETGAGSGNRQFRMIPVETGLYNDTLIEITSGLKEGDVVNLPEVARSDSGSAGGIFGGGSRPGRFMVGPGGSRPGGSSGGGSR